MNDQSKKVEPLRFEPAAPPAAAEESSAGPALLSNRNWVVPGLSVLVVLAVLVFFWLPSQVDTEAIEAEAAASTPVKPRAPVQEISPWSDAQLAKQRKAAQDILAMLLDEQFSLEELSVERWAPDEFAAAQALATEGDDLYRQQQFLEAASSYQAGLDAMEALSARVDEVFEAQMQAGLSALSSDQAEPAIAALELATILRPDLPEPQLALDRARNLAPLLELLAQAVELEKEADLEGAKALLEQARALDPQHPGAEAQLNTVIRNIARRDFNRAMSAGYAALDEARYDEAERQFKQARRIMPSAGETDAALQQTRTAKTAAQINAYKERALDAEGREDWNRATEAYQEILAIDNSVVFAQEGLERSRTRARLDGLLKKAIASPDRLSEDAAYASASQLYSYASALQPKGVILREQLEALDGLLRLAVMEIPVLFRSDQATDVRINRVEHLGTFSRVQLDLKPGTYTAVGTRSGFRDVRVVFRVSHDQDSPVVDVECTEPI